MYPDPLYYGNNEHYKVIVNWSLSTSRVGLMYTWQEEGNIKVVPLSVDTQSYYRIPEVSRLVSGS